MSCTGAFHKYIIDDNSNLHLNLIYLTRIPLHVFHDEIMFHLPVHQFTILYIISNCIVSSYTYVFLEYTLVVLWQLIILVPSFTHPTKQLSYRMTLV